MTEGNPTVEEAREDVIGALGELFMQIQRGGYRGQQVPVLPEVYLTTVDALIEAVRQEERERAGSVTGVDVGVELAYQDGVRTLKAFVQPHSDGA